MIKAVLFDLGGTLHVSTKSREREVWFARRVIHRLADYGIHLAVAPEALADQLNLNGEIYKAHVEATRRELPPDAIWNDYFLREQRIGRDRLALCAEELSFLYDYERVCNMRRPHLIQTLDRLKDMGLVLGVISNIISHSIVPHFMNEYGIAKYMACVITSADVLWRKPDPHIFRIAERQLGLKPEELAYVGDTVSRDVRGAQGAGWRLMIQIDNPGTYHRDLSVKDQFRPDYRISDLMEIPAIVQKERGDYNA